MPLDALLHHVPTALHGAIKRSRYLAARSNTLIIQADDSRKQSHNAHSCYQRLYEAIVQAAHGALPAETSAEQVERVKHLYVTLLSRPAEADKPTARRLITSAA